MTTCDSINSELGAVNSAANSINGKLDLVLSKIDALSNKVDSLQSKLDGLSNKIDTINNAIDSLENVLVTTINSIKDVLLAAINGLLDLIRSLLGGGNNDTDRILAAIAEARSALGTAIAEVGQIVVRQIRQTESTIIQAIADCCNALSAQISTLIGLINQLARKENPDRTNEILSKIDQATGSIKESIGGSERNIIQKIEEKCGGDILTKVLAAIAALAALFRDNKCDLSQVLTAISSCCSLLQQLIGSIDLDLTPALNAISNVQNTANQINNTTNQINNTVGQINTTVNRVDSTTTNISQTVNSIDNRISNITNYFSQLSNDLRNLSSYLNQIANNIDNSTTNIYNKLGDVTNNINSSAGNVINNITNEVNRTCGATFQIITGTLPTVDCNGNTIAHAYENIQQMVAILNNNINYVTSQVCELDTTELIEITIPVFASCNTERQPIFTDVSVFVPKGLEATELLKFQRIAEIEGRQCSNDAIALVPEWWQVRVEGGTPQFIMSFGEVDPATGKPTHAKYAITIPHFKNLKPEFCPIPTYKKGNYELIAYFKDNTKLIINAFNQQECERVYNSILPWIDESYLSTIKYKVGKRVSFLFKEVWVSPKFGKYFSMGNRELNPDWTVYFQ